MRIPERLEPLLDLGVIVDVLRPLKSGKEAAVFLVERPDGQVCVAKVYKEATVRSFKHRADYVEGRRTRNTRTQRAMSKKSRFGKEQIEEAWRNAEVDTLYRLRGAGVRVPEPFDFVEGVLLMALVTDARGEPAPSLADVELSPEEAEEMFMGLLQDVQRMLCAGVVHGDLSDFNVLIAEDGPVIIDFPQAVDPSHNRNAGRLLIRDVDNLQRFFGRWSARLRKARYGREMWDLYERSELEPDSVLTGKFADPTRTADIGGLLAEMEALEAEARRRRQALGLEAPSPPREMSAREKEILARALPPGGKGPKPRPKKGAPGPAPAASGPAPSEGEAGRRKRRRRKKRGGGVTEGENAPPSRANDDDPFADLDALLAVEPSKPPRER